MNLKFTVVGRPGQLAIMAFEDYADQGSIAHRGFLFNSGEPGAVVAKGSVQIAGPAAPETISGRVLSADGRPIRNVVVTISGNSLAVPLAAMTTSFGSYGFSGLAPGETYVVTVTSQRFTFQAPSRVVGLVENVYNADFIADQAQ
jgi:hypothetical protein